MTESKSAKRFSGAYQRGHPRADGTRVALQFTPDQILALASVEQLIAKSETVEQQSFWNERRRSMLIGWGFPADVD